MSSFGIYSPRDKFRPNVDMKRCRASVWSAFSNGQCLRKVAIVREGIGYCKQHDPVAIRAKSDARKAQWEADRKARNAQWEKERIEAAMADAALEAIKKIAAGHNDPAALARKVLSDDYPEKDDEEN